MYGKAKENNSNDLYLWEYKGVGTPETVAGIPSLDYMSFIYPLNNNIYFSAWSSSFGREIWKVIAIAALVLFFLEGLLARWVSKSRRAGEEVRVDFERRDEVPAEFLKSVAQTKGGPR